MKKIKHSKFKNTGVLFELLVRQITLEVLNGDKTENAKNIVKEFFASGTVLCISFSRLHTQNILLVCRILN
jgi:hypothetical protein